MNFELRHLEKSDWTALAAQYADYSYLHTWEYGVAAAARVGAHVENLAITDNDEVIALASVRVKKLPLVRAGLAYINGGPLIRRNSDIEDALRVALFALKEEYVRRRRLTLRIAPRIMMDIPAERVCAVFEELGFDAAAGLRKYRTIVVNTQPPIDAIRKALGQKWRNCLNAATRNELVVRKDESTAGFAEFCTLYRELMDRKQFAVDQDAEFFRSLQANLPSSERLVVTLAESAGAPVAGHVASYLGDTGIYLLGATSQQGLSLKASYLLQWEAIKVAQERGCSCYDLGGIDPVENPGVYHFKSGMGGREVIAPGPFQCGAGAASTKFVELGEKVARSLRGRFKSR